MEVRAPTTDSVSSSRSSRSTKLAHLVLEAAVGLGGWYALYCVAKHLINTFDPMSPHRASVNKTKQALADKLKRPEIMRQDLSEYEKIMADEVMDPAQIETGFDDVGGLEQEKKEIYELVVLPLRRPDMFNKPGSLLSSPKGILFYGVPGTGKTLLAKAIAKESGAAFMNVRMSVLMNKYFGESNKLVAAVFSLAYKIAPCVVFIDEIDSFLRQRGGVDDSAWVSLKAEFMTLWDGLLSQSSVPVIVLGATNRPYDLDQAILRRMPRQFEIPLPQTPDRQKIINILLRNENVDWTSVTAESLAALTEGYSGSDLKEVCRAAVMLPMRAQIPYGSSASLASMNVGSMRLEDCRKVTMDDFKHALQRVRPTGVSAHEYRERETNATANRQAPPPASFENAINNAQMLAMLQAIFAAMARSNEGGQQAGFEDCE